MSKFCIDLEGVMLPDAIAAVVEAWYDAQIIQPATKELAFDQMLSISNEIIKDKQRKSKLKLSIYIEKRGDKFAIRGRLPSRNNPTENIIQRISIGVPAKLENVKQVEILTIFLIDQLKCGDFLWEKWSDKNYIASICENINVILNPSPPLVNAI